MTPPAGLIFSLQTQFRFPILCVVLRTEEEYVEWDARGHTRDTEADRHTVNFSHENFQLIAINEGALSLWLILSDERRVILV